MKCSVRRSCWTWMRATSYGWNDCMGPCNTYVDGNVHRSYNWRHFTWGLPPRPTSGRRTSPFESVTVVQHHRPTSPSTPPNPRCHPAIRSQHYHSSIQFPPKFSQSLMPTSITPSQGSKFKLFNTR